MSTDETNRIICIACGLPIDGDFVGNDDGPVMGPGGMEFNIAMHPDCWKDMDAAMARRRAREAVTP